jgi:hypothetical protein
MSFVYLNVFIQIKDVRISMIMELKEKHDNEMK